MRRNNKAVIYTALFFFLLMLCLLFIHPSVHLLLFLIHWTVYFPARHLPQFCQLTPVFLDLSFCQSPSPFRFCFIPPSVFLLSLIWHSHSAFPHLAWFFFFFFSCAAWFTCFFSHSRFFFFFFLEWPLSPPQSPGICLSLSLIPLLSSF